MILVFGGGYLGEAIARRAGTEGARAVLTSRSAERRQRLEAAGYTALNPEDETALASAAAEAHAIVVAAPALETAWIAMANASGPGAEAVRAWVRAMLPAA